jgi:uncharacterized coiled-coil protein SlyX
MTENKTILEGIKKLLFGEVAPPVPPTPPAEPIKMLVDVPLEDGTTVLKADKLEVGGVVTLNDMPAPDGEHKLADGKILQTSGGVIVEISSPQEDLIPEEMKQLPVKMAAQESTINSLKKENANLKEAVSQLLKFTENLNERVEKFGEQSKAKPAEQVEGLTANFKETLKNRGKI